MKNQTHQPAKCKRDVLNTHYVGKGYKSKFTCPVCGRFCWQHLNFLGSRSVVCDGRKFSKVDIAERIDALKNARLTLEQAFARLGMFTSNPNDVEAQRIINWAIYDIDLELSRLIREVR